MNINALSPQGVVRAQGKEMDLNSVLIYMNIYSAYRALHRQDKVNIEQGGKKKREMEVSPRAGVSCFVFGSVICSPFDSWQHPFHFALLSFYFSPCPRPRTACTCSIPHSPTLDPHRGFGWVSDTAGGHTLRTWAPLQNRLKGNVILRTNG